MWLPVCALVLTNSKQSSNQSATATLDGFTITRGNANAGFGATGEGGGVYLGNNSNPSLANLLFNQASAMTASLQTSYVQQNYGSLTAYGTYASIWSNWGTTVTPSLMLPILA